MITIRATNDHPRAEQDTFWGIQRITPEEVAPFRPHHEALVKAHKDYTDGMAPIRAKLSVALEQIESQDERFNASAHGVYMDSFIDSFTLKDRDERYRGLDAEEK